MMITNCMAASRSGWLIIRFTKTHRVSWGALVSGVYGAGEMAGFPPEIAAKIVSSGSAVYAEATAQAAQYRAK